MKVLTLRQPWASLVVLGAKTIETRSFSTKYRGPLAIHAGAGIPSYLGLGRRGRAVIGAFEVERDPAGLLLRGNSLGWPYRLPLGEIVAVCEVVDVVPIHEWGCKCDHAGVYALICPKSFGQGDMVGLFSPGVGDYQHPAWSADKLDCLATAHPRQQAPYGDYRCGRFAWLLDDVQRLSTPVPFRGGQGFTRSWEPDLDALGDLAFGTAP